MEVRYTHTIYTNSTHDTHWFTYIVIMSITALKERHTALGGRLADQGATKRGGHHNTILPRTLHNDTSAPLPVDSKQEC